MFVTLVYHLIDRTIDAKVAIAEEAFEAQLRHLREKNYTILSLAQAIAILNGEQEAPSRSVLLTFDDGYANNLYVALPLLQEYGMTATQFVISAHVGQTNRWNPRANYDVNHMTWDELRQWWESGCDIGGHSHEHFWMTRLSKPEMQEAVVINKLWLEKQLDLPMRAFSYPYGAYNQQVQAVVKEYYELAFAVDPERWDTPVDRFAIPRLSVQPRWSIEDFTIRLEKVCAIAAAQSHTA
ncbi:MAG: polysaccharide deacetylase family protein [Ktedonobacteraceae bacterium]